MSTQFNAISAEVNQNRAYPAKVVPVRPQSIAGITRLVTVILCFLILSTLAVVVVDRQGIAPTIIEPSQYLLPGNVPPKDIRCEEFTNETCYPPFDGHCYLSGDANCFISASIQHNGKIVHLTINTASRLIAYTRIPAQEYTLGDLILAWGTPSGFTQYGRDIDVYWDARNASLTTCAFRPESRVEIITYYHINPASVSPWRGFKQDKSKDCG